MIDLQFKGLAKNGIEKKPYGEEKTKIGRTFQLLFVKITSLHSHGWFGKWTVKNREKYAKILIGLGNFKKLKRPLFDEKKHERGAAIPRTGMAPRVGTPV